MFYRFHFLLIRHEDRTDKTGFPFSRHVIHNIFPSYGQGLGESVCQCSPARLYMGKPHQFQTMDTEPDYFTTLFKCCKVGGKKPGDLFAGQSGFQPEYPWDLLNFLPELLNNIPGSPYDVSRVSPLASVSGTLKLGSGSTILPGVVIDGHVVIGKNCKIGPNCYIRGMVSIGDDCVIGQGVEIKSSIIGDRTWISHLAYAGDSIIGSDVNFGAGTVCSNYRHDGAEHKAMWQGRLVNTGRDKLGAIIGDGVRLGSNTTIYPARMIAPGSRTLPGQVVDRNIGC